jgi:hypothetical protein
MKNTFVRHPLLVRVAASAALTLGSVTLAQANPPAPPVSDGSSGSYSAQLGSSPGNYFFNSFNTDTGQGEGCESTACPWHVTIPFKVVKYNGQTVHEFNFTDINVQSFDVPMTIYGSTPALFLANQGISIAAPMHFLNGGGAGGADAPLTGSAPGGPGGGRGGATGGVGQAGETTGCGGNMVWTGSGGGGGGNYSAGQPGLTNFWPPAGAGTNPDYPPGPGGPALPRALLAGGGGAGGGGGNYAGNFYTTQGGQGGGAVAFGSTSTIDITSTGSVSTNGQPGQVQQASAGSGGGGAAGSVFFFASSGFTNEGLVSAQGGEGGTNTITTYEPDCQTYVTLPGPNGGNGSGGFVVVTAGTIANTGMINVGDGGGASASGGWVKYVGKVTKSGKIIGRK